MFYVESEILNNSTNRIPFSIKINQKLFSEWLEEKVRQYPVYLDIETHVSILRTHYAPVLKTVNSSSVLNLSLNEEVIVTFPKSISLRQANNFQQDMTTEILVWLQEEFQLFQSQYKTVMS